MQIGDRVYVKDWGKLYSDIYRWKDGKRSLVWDWLTPIPDHSSITFHRTDNKYENYQYEIKEKTLNKINGKIVCLLASTNSEIEPLRCYIQIEQSGLIHMSPEQQNRVKHLVEEESLQALAVDNLGKWSIDHNLKEFPKQLLKYLYDENQTTQLGSSKTKAIIRYPYISKEYTIQGNDICLGWEQNYNGKGCSLIGKETISWDELSARFPENTFER